MTALVESMHRHAQLRFLLRLGEQALHEDESLWQLDFIRTLEWLGTKTRGRQP
jgi:hypothetical protein